MKNTKSVNHFHFFSMKGANYLLNGERCTKISQKIGNEKVYSTSLSKLLTFPE